MTIYFIKGARHRSGDDGPYSHMLATQEFQSFIVSKLPESFVFSIRFEGVYTDKKGRHLLEEATFLDGDGEEMEVDGDIQVNEKFASYVRALDEYAGSMIDIDDDGEYLLTESAAGFGQGDGSYFSEHADKSACDEIQGEYGCFEFRGWISDD